MNNTVVINIGKYRWEGCLEAIDEVVKGLAREGCFENYLNSCNELIELPNQAYPFSVVWETMDHLGYRDAEENFYIALFDSVTEQVASGSKNFSLYGVDLEVRVEE